MSNFDIVAAGVATRDGQLALGNLSGRDLQIWAVFCDGDGDGAGPSADIDQAGIFRSVLKGPFDHLLRFRARR
jgi:hypothetical protein